MYRLFNLDAHISVISDVKDIFKKLYGEDVEITNWSISGDRWVFGFPYVNVKHITQRSWKNLNPEAIAAFQKEYDSYLSEFDGFIVTHTPAFAQIFEKYGKPIIMVNSCRYNQPYCWNNDVAGQHALNASLKRMVSAGQLHIVSNNKADQEYLRLGTGLDSKHIPSLCAYTNVKHDPATAKDITLSYGWREKFPACERMLNKRNGSTWKEIYNCQAIFHCPYEASTMSIAEQYTAGVPLFLPSKTYYEKMAEEDPPFMKSIYMKQCHDDFYDALEPTFDLQFWIDRADFYDQDNMPYLYYYDSPEDAVEKAATFKEEPEIRAKRDAFIEGRTAKILTAWDQIFKTAFADAKPALRKVAATWDEPDRKGFEMCSANNVGQINKGSILGDMLCAIAADPAVKTILEVGTWNGRGSTRCLAEGVAKRPDATLWSLECNSEKAAAAAALYNQPNIHILNEVLFKGIPADFDEKFPDLSKNADFIRWFKTDIKNMKNANIFKKQQSYDFVLLDGGEFTTYYDFMEIKDSFKMLIVDNATTYKGSLIKKYVQEHPDKYELVFEHPERNGFVLVRARQA